MALATRAPETSEISLTDLLKFNVVDGRSRILDIAVRSDESGRLLSVKDLISTVVGCNQIAAERKIAKLKADGHINTEGANTQFEYFMDGSYRVLGAPIDAFAGLCAHLKGRLALQIHRRSCANSCRLDAGDKTLHALIDRQAEVVDRGVIQGNALAIALAKTRLPYEETGTHRIELDRRDRGGKAALVLEACDQSNEAIEIITRVLHDSVRYKTEMIEMKKITDSVRTDDKYLFLREATFPVSFYEHANQCVYGFTCSTMQFKVDNQIPARAQLCWFMNREQLVLVVQFVKMCLKQLLRDHKAGEYITQAHVKSVSQKFRDSMLQTSKNLDLDQLDTKEDASARNIFKEENEKLAISTRLGKSQQSLENMPEATKKQKQLKKTRSGRVENRIKKAAEKFRLAALCL